MVFIAVALHHRNSNGTSSRNIGGGGTGNAAKQGTGDNRDLGGSTYYLTEQQHGDVHEQLEASGYLQKTGKNHEDCDSAGCRPQRRTKNTFCAQTDISNNALESNARMSDRCGEILTENHVEQDEPDNARQRPAIQLFSGKNDTYKNDAAYDQIQFIIGSNSV